jgi:hypothetical protein
MTKIVTAAPNESHKKRPLIMGAGSISGVMSKPIVISETAHIAQPKYPKRGRIVSSEAD